jgi:hypothetical protein
VDKKRAKILYVENELVPTEKMRNWNVGKASYFVRRKRHTFAVILRRFTFFLGRITYVILRLVPTEVVRMTKNIERIDAVFARSGVKSAKRNVFQSLACIIPIPATLNYIDKV